MTNPAAVRRVNATFSHIAAPADFADPAEGGVSFLELLVRRFTYHSAGEWLDRIHDGRVTLEGRAAAPDALVAPRMRLEYRVDDYPEPAVPLDFREIRADGDLALVHKPAGLPVHKTGKVFVNVLANLYRRLKGDDAWTPLNRLDAETSGIVAFARGVRANGRSPLRDFAPGNPGTIWIKTYLAVTQADPGAAPLPDFHDGPLAEWPEHPIRSRMRVHPDGKAALTRFRTLLTQGGKSLVLARPVTGRKHQIRAHLADLGYPVVGDKVYSLGGRYYIQRLEGELDEAAVSALQAPHQLLHAAGLEIRDAEGNGIAGTDFDLPEGFRRFFPEVTEDFLRNFLRHDLFAVA